MEMELLKLYHHSLMNWFASYLEEDFKSIHSTEQLINLVLLDSNDYPKVLFVISLLLSQ